MTTADAQGEWLAAAGWLAEALETGNPLAPLPPPLTPPGLAEAEAIAAEVVDRLRLPVCGLRLAPGPGGARLAGPMVETRLLRDGATLALSALRHARGTPAVVAVLAAPLEPGETTAPLFAALHPAIDVAASRFRDPPGDAALALADLAGLGQVVVGRGRPASAEAIPAPTLLPAGQRAPRARSAATGVDLPALLEEAAAAARRLGGLPAGAVLVLAGLGPSAMAPEAGQRLVARLGPDLGRVTADFA